MGVKIIPVVNLSLNTVVTDPDILRDLNEKEPLKVVALKAGNGSVTVTFEGERRHTDTFGNLFALEVKTEPTKEVHDLKTALRELEGFACRNVERARKAAEDATKRGLSSGTRERIEAEARHHDAVRFHQVIKLRVEEALHEK